MRNKIIKSKPKGNVIGAKSFKAFNKAKKSSSNDRGFKAKSRTSKFESKSTSRWEKPVRNESRNSSRSSRSSRNSSSRFEKPVYVSEKIDTRNVQAMSSGRFRSDKKIDRIERDMSEKRGYSPRAESRAPRNNFRNDRSSGRAERNSNSAPSRGGRKSAFRGKYIDERMFVNKGAKTTEIASYEAKHAFVDFEIAEALSLNLSKRGYIKPSPIQDQSIPAALAGKDVIGIAATGTGKTAAFLIPIINKIEKDRNQKAMVLAPTRELALQIQKEFLDFTGGMKLFSTTCVGGAPIFPQIRELGRGVHLVVGTPGRVKDLIARGKIKMSNYNTIVLDEADRMLDMGFIDDMREILSLMPKDKQSLFFSATFDTKVKALCNDFLRDPVTVSVKTRDTSASVDQDVVRIISKSQKVDQLHEILNTEDAKKVLIFREMKRSVDELTSELNGRGIKALGLHGDMRNRERERAVLALKEGRIQALIATDVAARGIHISDISHVINYDIPNDYETYIHRIGRTGRGEAKGIALTFI